MRIVKLFLTIFAISVSIIFNAIVYLKSEYDYVDQESSKLKLLIKKNDSNLSMLNRKKNLMDDRLQKIEQTNKLIIEKQNKLIEENKLLKLQESVIAEKSDTVKNKIGRERIFTIDEELPNKIDNQITGMLTAVII